MIRLLIILLILSFNVSAQTTLPDSITKKIIIELIQKDSLSNELYYSNIHLNLLEDKLILKDKIIIEYQSKEINYDKQIFNLEKNNSQLNRKNKNLKIKNRILGTSTSLLLGIIGIFIILK